MANYSDVNFIKHLLGISEKFIDDDRLSPLHISLYYALFHSWNLSKFRVPISISRSELMHASKIGSANTYTKCLKELDAWEYIKYFPSHNPHKGSQIHMYNFNKTTNNGSDISNNKSTNNTTKKTIAKGSVNAVIPYINSLNNTNISNSLNEALQQQHNNSNIFSDDNSKSNFKRQGTKKEKSSAKKEKGLPNRAESRCFRPLLEELKIYFTQNKSEHIEAEKFYNHYESNGWLVGGKTPMKNWKASVNNWILNSVKFSNGKANSSNNKASNRAGQLHTAIGKDYSEPL